MKLVLAFAMVPLTIAWIVLLHRISRYRKDIPPWERHVGHFPIRDGPLFVLLSRNTYTREGRRLLPWFRLVALLASCVSLALLWFL